MMEGRSESYALVVAAAALFIVLSIVMAVTQRVPCAGALRRWIDKPAWRGAGRLLSVALAPALLVVAWASPAEMEITALDPLLYAMLLSVCLMASFLEGIIGLIVRNRTLARDGLLRTAALIACGFLAIWSGSAPAFSNIEHGWNWMRSLPPRLSCAAGEKCGDAMISNLDFGGQMLTPLCHDQLFRPLDRAAGRGAAFRFLHPASFNADESPDAFGKRIDLRSLGGGYFSVIFCDLS